MNMKEKPLLAKSEEQKPYQTENLGSILLNEESLNILNGLSSKLNGLQRQLNSPEVRRIGFNEQGGEQSIGKEMASLQMEKLPKIFSGVDFESPHLQTHDTQTEQYSCQLATAANVLTALGISTTEKEIAEAVGKSGSVADIWTEELSTFLRNRGLEVSRIYNALEIINSLIKGGKIILPLMPPKYPIPHTIAVSGVKIKDGKIEFYINDSQYKNYAETISLGDIVDVAIPYSFNELAPIYAVSRKITEDKST